MVHMGNVRYISWVVKRVRNHDPRSHGVRITTKVLAGAVQLEGVVGSWAGWEPTDRAGRMIRRTSRSKGLAGVKRRTDEDLVEAYLQGDQAALVELIARFRQDLLSFLTRYLGSHAAAEDVFQETFLQVHLSADMFDLTRRFKPWLFTIAANKARDYYRKHRRRTMVSLSARVNRDDEGSSFVDLLEADLPSPDAPVLDAERTRVVRIVIDSLPAHLREILLLSYFQRLSYSQIAGSLHIPLGTVKSRLHTAVATFAKAWKAARVRQGRER